jgi:hypothetical protein
LHGLLRARVVWYFFAASTIGSSILKHLHLPSFGAWLAFETACNHFVSATPGNSRASQPYGSSC